PGVDVVRAGADDPLALGRSDHCCERHLVLVVHAAERLRSCVGERFEVLEEARAHIICREPVEELLHGPRVGRPRWAYVNLAAIAQLDVTLLCHGIGHTATEQLVTAEEA